ncbi:hypothetical protein DPMN_101074 [Dreissena polymorpha]|uniref:Uncharacterized protein n=1 Tax=Dreissena polymorpha TaxID=45954 RepID=A0A9D4R803_DREPO|nr:hypothetical protein DPMN_101074 [Dreissena polymorpha]
MVHYNQDHPASPRQGTEPSTANHNRPPSRHPLPSWKNLLVYSHFMKEDRLKYYYTLKSSNPYLTIQ